MEKKYKLTEESINYYGKKLYRIEALKDFGDVKKGDKGGYVESEKNLSQKDDCWIYDDAKVFDDAQVYDNARVYDDAEVYGESQIFGDARVLDNAIITDNAKICGIAQVYNDTLVDGKALITENARIYNNAQVSGNALVCGNAKVCNKTQIYGNAVVKNNSDYIVFKNWWSSGRCFTWTRSNNMWCVGCFYGTGEELIQKAYEDSKLSGKEYERVVNYVESILQDSK